jgi:hypothetical protein
MISDGLCTAMSRLGVVQELPEPETMPHPCTAETLTSTHPCHAVSSTNGTRTNGIYQKQDRIKKYDR